MPSSVGVVPKKDELLANPNKYVKVNSLGEGFIFEESSSGIVSDPPSGCHKILNIWRNALGNIEYEYEDVPIP